MTEASMTPSDVISAFTEILAGKVQERLDARDTKQTVSPWLNVEDAAEYLGLTPRFVYELAGSKRIPTYREGRRLLFHRDELDQWADQGFPASRGRLLTQRVKQLEQLVASGKSLQEALGVVPSKSGDGNVYFIQCDEYGPIKIGFTAGDPNERMAAIQTGNPFKLHLRSVINAGRHIERELHIMFKDLRMQGEWFYARRDLALIAGANETPDT